MLTIQQKLRPENHERIEQMRTTIANQQVELSDVNTRLEVLTSEYSKLDKKMKEATDEIWNLNSIVQPFMNSIRERKPFLEAKWGVTIDDDTLEIKEKSTPQSKKK